MDNVFSCIYKAVYDFRTDIHGELTLNVGDIIKCERIIDAHWWYGIKISDQRSQSGSFPASYVSKINVPAFVTSAQNWYVAVEDFVAERPGDLSFLKGDLIIDVRQICVDWLEGTSGIGFKNRGVFPANFAKRINFPGISPETSNKYTSSQRTCLPVNQNHAEAINVRARVTKKLDAKLPEEISLDVGEVVIIEKFLDKLWCEGRTENNKKRGIFPIGFVEILEHDGHSIANDTTARLFSTSTSEASKFTDLPSFSGSAISAQESQKDENFVEKVNNERLFKTAEAQGSSSFCSGKSSVPSSINGSYGRTIYEFLAEYPEELSFPANQTIRLIKHVDEDWTLGEYKGRKGIFPTSYIDLIVDRTLCTSKEVDADKTNGPFEQTTRRVVYNFSSAVEGDLEARVGDVLEVMHNVDSNWIQALNTRTNRIGLIPLSFLAEDYVSSACHTIEDKSFHGMINNGPCQQFSNLRCLIAEGTEPNTVYKTASTSELRTAFADSSQINQVRRTGRISQTLPKQAPSRPSSQPVTTAGNQNLLLEQKRLLKQIEEKKLENRAQKIRITNEILQSEQDYVKDLSIFCQEVQNSEESLNLDNLMTGFDKIQLVGHKLVKNLEEEIAKDFVYQEIGNAFLKLEADFKEVYGSFCQSYENVHVLLHQYEADSLKTKILNELLQKINMRTRCVDLNSALSRPIQRVLKYPLFISELLKCTEDNTSDKVKLIMALKVMTDVARCINESKRRKELVQKYIKEDDSSFSTRLSKLNLHTFRKKSNRLSMRLSTSIGLTQSLKDDEFDAFEKQFKSIEKSSRSFLRDAENYCENLLASINHGLSIAENFNALLTSHSSTKSQEYAIFWSEIISLDLQCFYDDLRLKVREPVNALHLSCKGPEKLIAKRRDKLLDFESATSRLCKERSKNETADASKMKILEEDLGKCKVEFEALDLQLKTELPQFVEYAYEILAIASKAFISSQRSFVYDIGRRQSNSTLQAMNENSDTTKIAEDFRQSIGPILDNLSQITFQSTSKKSSFCRKSSLARKSSSSTTSSTEDQKNDKDVVYAQIITSHRFQTEADKIKVTSKYPADKTFQASVRYSPTHEMDLSLDVGDVVGVIVNKDPMGNDQRWFVDNGASKGFVPRSVLVGHSKELGPNQAIKSDNSRTSVEYAEISRFKTKLLQQQNQERVDTTACQSSLRQKSEINLDKSITLKAQRPDSQEKTTENADLNPACVQRSKTVSLEPTTLGLTPVRSAPPPPPPVAKNEASASMDFYVAKYFYEAKGDSELFLKPDDLLCVLAKQDLQQNDEWWLVENEAGDIGYVPANYLSPSEIR